MLKVIKSRKHKNNKVLYYTINFARQLYPGMLFRSRLSRKLSAIKHYDTDYIKKRLNYYNKLSQKVELTGNAKPLSEFKLGKKLKTYFFDCFEFTRYYSRKLKIDYVFGDVTKVPAQPAFVKSRPIHGDNANSVVLKLNKVRHFTFTRDAKDFTKKLNMLVGRMNASQPQRIKFLEMFFNHPLCNVGQVNADNKGNPNFLVERLTIEQQLDYKFIACIEGFDVASSLKWVMSSNSLAVMPKPKYETWFMEGTLIPDYHYVLIKDDYSDLEDRIKYYSEHTDEALQIIEHAHEHVNQFKNKQQEDLISLLVLEKYFYQTGQKMVNKNIGVSLFSFPIST